jgi:hypothetical protein
MYKCDQSNMRELSATAQGTSILLNNSILKTRDEGFVAWAFGGFSTNREARWIVMHKYVGGGGSRI